MKTSVLINNYNHAAFLHACIESVLRQTHPADEVILYDDGSSDDSLAIARTFGSRITIIAGQRRSHSHRESQGHAIHEAFIRSHGDVIFLLDSDDLFTPSKIEHYLTAFRSAEPRPILVQAPMAWISEGGIPVARMPEPFKHTEDPFATAYSRSDPDLFYPTSALAFSRDFLARALPIDWSDGVDLWADARLSMAALVAGPITTLPNELGAWRQHANSDASRAPTYQLRQTCRRVRVFNRLCEDAGAPTISLWQSHRFYLQLLRLAAPRGVYNFYRKHWVRDAAKDTTGHRALRGHQIGSAHSAPPF